MMRFITANKKSRMIYKFICIKQTDDVEDD